MNNPNGLNAPLKEWTHEDVVVWMEWEIIKGITSGVNLRAVVQGFPFVISRWTDEVAKDKKPTPSRKKKPQS